MKKIIIAIFVAYLSLQILLAVRIYNLHQEKNAMFAETSKLLMSNVKFNFIDHMLILVSINSQYENQILLCYHITTLLIMITFIGTAILYRHYRH